MFAVLKTGGKQYRVQSGDVLRVEKLAAEPGDKVQFNDILMIGSTIGAPMVSGAGVVAETGAAALAAFDEALAQMQGQGMVVEQQAQGDQGAGDGEADECDDQCGGPGSEAQTHQTIEHGQDQENQAQQQRPGPAERGAGCRR